MSIKVTFTATGPLHQNPQSHFKKAVSKSLDDTAKYGKGLIQDRTPVRTGNLQRGWSIAKPNNDELSIYNDVKYVRFVEAKIHMAFRSEEEIQNFLNQQLNQNIPKYLN
jgi:hypothetical protein